MTTCGNMKLSLKESKACVSALADRYAKILNRANLSPEQHAEVAMIDSLLRRWQHPKL